MKGNEYNITYPEACKILKKSRKTISRYIKKGLLKPEKVKSKKGTLEYRFKRSELKNLKNLDRTEGKTQDRPKDRTGHKTGQGAKDKSIYQTII